MPNLDANGGGELVGDSIPETPTERVARKPQIREPWYRPAKQYLRREQWNADILHLLNRLPETRGGPATIRYIGLPGQHYLDLLSMGRICHAKNLLIEYLGFRIGDGPNAQAEYLSELSILSDQSHFTANSITLPDTIHNVALPKTIAAEAFSERGPYDVVNLDVCGGVLHGNSTPLLRAIKHVLTSQAERPLPWLLFVTTTAKAKDIEPDVITRFFSAVISNCTTVDGFRASVDGVADRLGLNADDCLNNPATVQQNGFQRFFTLAFGKWLLANLAENNPRSTVSLRSVYAFRNTDRAEPEMLSLAYLVTPFQVGGGADPTQLTGEQLPDWDAHYAQTAIDLVSASIANLIDLDGVWNAEPEVKGRIISESEDLLRAIGVDDEGVAQWRIAHGIVAPASV